MEDQGTGKAGTEIHRNKSDKPVKLWFIDKHTCEKAVVFAEEMEDGTFSLSYKGKQFTFSADLLGKRIFPCPPEVQEKESEKETKKELFYQGEYFRFEDALWTSHAGYTPKRNTRRGFRNYIKSEVGITVIR